VEKVPRKQKSSSVKDVHLFYQGESGADFVIGNRNSQSMNIDLDHSFPSQ